jgi:hypothetical protein
MGRLLPGYTRSGCIFVAELANRLQFDVSRKLELELEKRRMRFVAATM